MLLAGTDQEPLLLSKEGFPSHALGDPSFLISILHAFPAQVRPVLAVIPGGSCPGAPSALARGADGGGDDPGDAERGLKRALAELIGSCLLVHPHKRSYELLGDHELLHTPHLLLKADRRF